MNSINLRYEDIKRHTRRACFDRVSGAQLNVDIMNARCRIPGILDDIELDQPVLPEYPDSTPDQQQKRGIGESCPFSFYFWKCS
ncbi:hypothetical protein QYF36_012692 [Acer negundo]|nr:hypothetical protein QYF36_012692 [Acer negundo]